MTRYWHLPGGIIAKDEVDPIGWNCFWYCFRCGERYAESWTTDAPRPWKALSGCCPKCEGHRFMVPGSLETIMLVGWKVPLSVLRYQLDCEIAFTRNVDHPWNKEEQNVSN